MDFKSAAGISTLTIVPSTVDVFVQLKGTHSGQGIYRRDEMKKLRDFLNATYPVATVTPRKAGKAPSKAKQAYKGNGKHQWEKVTTNTERLRVPDGWLYSVYQGVARAVTFVPLPKIVGHAI